MQISVPQAPPAPPAPPMPPIPPVPAIAGIPGQEPIVFLGGDGASAQAVYQALKAQRRELENRRQELSQRLEEPMVGGADRKGLEGRITEVDQRISAIDKQIAESEAQIARQAAVPGAAVEPRQPRREGPPEEVFILGGIFIFVVLLPLSIAMARRIWRRGVATITKLPAELTE